MIFPPQLFQEFFCGSVSLWLLLFAAFLFSSASSAVGHRFQDRLEEAQAMPFPVGFHFGAILVPERILPFP